MSRFVKKIDLNVLDAYSRLFLDFAAQSSRGLTGFSRKGEFWNEAANVVDTSSRDEDRDTWGAVVDEITSLSRRLGTRGDVVEKLRMAQRREVFFVVTGQQPGTLGGPLVTVYKISTAIALSRFLERVTERPCVPLYWCGSDDTDFQEIRGLNLLTRAGMPFSAAIPQKAHRGGLPTGDIALEWLDQVWKNVRRFVDDFEAGGFVARVIGEAFEKARDHGEAAAAILVGLLDGRFAVIDGRSPAVRRHARSVIVRYIAHEDDIKKTITEQGARLEASAYHAQLTVGNDSGVFLLEGGLRKAVTPDLRSALVDAADRAVENCSPGVIVRTLVQDYAIKPIAVVLGPAEIAYRSQTDVLYPRFQIPTPAAVPRLTATYLPPELLTLVGAGDGSGIENMLKDPSGFARTIYGHEVPEVVDNAAREFEARISDAANRFSKTLETGPTSKTLGRIRWGISDIKNRAARTAGATAEIGKAIALERWPFLSGLEAAIRPGGKLQERSLSGLMPFLYGGGDTAGELVDIGSIHVDDLLDGRMSHIVYSSKE